jgi:hypothetical protein
MVLTAVGLLWFAQISASGSYLADILGPSVLSAFGLGFAFVAMTVAAVAGVEGHEAGLASGLINTSQQVGGALGLAVLAAIANSRTDSLLGDGIARAEALTRGFGTAMTVGAGFAVAGALLAVFAISGRASREHALAAQAGEVETVAVSA